MIKHVVMWRYKNESDIETARKELEGMRGKIPSMFSIEIGVNFLIGPASYDLVLITEHEDRTVLDAYQADPVHRGVKNVLGKLNNQQLPAKQVVCGLRPHRGLTVLQKPPNFRKRHLRQSQILYRHHRRRLPL